MKNKLLIIFLVMSFVLAAFAVPGVTFADDEDEYGSSFEDENQAYTESVDSGDIDVESDNSSALQRTEEDIIAQTQFEDIAGESCEEAVRVLNGLGIVYGVSDEEFNSEGNTTKGQLASLILRMMNLSGKASSGVQMFSDVSPTHPNFNDIMSAYSLGIVHGNGDGTFTPDAVVSVSELIKMVVCALGYDVVAQARGGYPSGYYAVASELDLTDGADISGDSITRGDTSIIIYNALTVDIFERTSYGDTENYKAKENDNILTRYRDCDIAEGIVTDNGITALDGKTVLEPGRVRIDDKIFECGGLDLKNLLGRYVKAYYKQGNANVTGELIVCYAHDLCTELFLKADDILFAEWENGFFVFDYSDGNKEKKVSVFADSFIYNGKHMPADEHDFRTLVSQNKCIKATIISNDGDKSGEVLIIDEYKSGEVLRVDTINNKIYCDDSEGGSFVISLESKIDDVIYDIYNEKGNKTNISSVRTGDVISFFESVDKTVYTIHVSKKRIGGKINEIADDKYVIEGNVFTRYPKLPESMLEIGVEGVFLVDIYGNIVSVEAGNILSKNYGLLMDVKEAKKSGLDVYPAIRILNTDGIYETYECEHNIVAYNPDSGKVEKVEFSDLICTQKTELNYENVSPHMLWYTDNSANFTYDIRANNLAGAYQKRFYYRPWLTDNEKSDIASRKVIYFEKNKNGRVDKIIVPDIPSDESKLSLMNYEGSYGMIYRNENNIALDYVKPGTLKISPHAVVYQALALDYTEKDYTVAENGVYSINNGQVCKMYLYETNDSVGADIVLRYYHLPYESRGNIIPVAVSRISRDSDDKIKLYGYSQGREFEAVIKENTRLVQRNIYFDDILTTSNSSKADSLKFETRVNGKNLFDCLFSVNNELDESAKATKSFYDLYEGMTWPYADENSISKGDILLVGYNGGEELCYVEVLMRADDGLMQVTRESTDFVGKVTNSNDFAMGVVRSFEESTAAITVFGPGDSWNRRYTTYGDLKVSTSSTKTSDGRFNALSPYFYETHNYEINYSQCFVWEYDYKRNAMKKLSGSSLEVGDTVIIRGNEYSPREIIVLKNNDAVPNLEDCEMYEMMSGN